MITVLYAVAYFLEQMFDAAVGRSASNLIDQAGANYSRMVNAALGPKPTPPPDYLKPEDREWLDRMRKAGETWI